MEKVLTMLPFCSNGRTHVDDVASHVFGGSDRAAYDEKYAYDVYYLDYDFNLCLLFLVLLQSCDLRRLVSSHSTQARALHEATLNVWSHR